MHAGLATSAPLIARVEPLTRTRAVRGPFDYRLRPDQTGVDVGTVLRVPFGGQKTLGVVLEVVDRSELAPERLVEPDAILPPGLPPDLVALAGWIAEQYCSTPARALSLVLPPPAGARRRAQVLLATLTHAGSAALAGAERLTDRQKAALAQLQSEGAAPAARIGTATLRRLEARGRVELRPRDEPRRPQSPAVGRRLDATPTLSAQQHHTLREILRALRGDADPAARRFLLHGVTGSGKTEVYLQAVEATLAAGRSAIVLVPEIALTPQTVGRFQARFGDIVAVLHSGLGRRERHDEWMRLRSGQARVCVGPRSAVFAPLARIGLIVVDEEHDPSYKQHEGDPRYDARRVALRRAEQHAALLLAGSATPRPESVVTLARLRLPERIDRRPLPPVEVLDMRGLHHSLHPRTRMALADVRAAGAKAIVLLNRRGWSNFLSCRGCGHVWMCPNCEVALVLHGAQGFLACHHCGHRRPAPTRCEQCGSVAVARHGAGTESVEHELRDAFGRELPVFRLDGDAAAGRGRLAATLAQFESAPAGILLGTQMVAKGHDFADVALGVVLDADQTLRFPDFRAEERTFALVTQLAGRVGRGEDGGRVLVQTLAPGARSIVLASRHDTDAFLTEELMRRQALAYPPYGSLLRVVCSSPDPEDALALATRLHGLIAGPGPADQAQGVAGAGGTVLGPAPLFRLRGRSRSQLVVKCRDRLAMVRAVGAAVNECAAEAVRRGVSVSVDPDPQ